MPVWSPTTDLRLLDAGEKFVISDKMPMHGDESVHISHWGIEYVVQTISIAWCAREIGK